MKPKTELPSEATLPKSESKPMNELSEIARFSIRELAERIAALRAELDAVKPLYDEIDSLTVDLVKLGETRIVLDEFRTLEILDNFAEKNTVFRPCGVKRFEAKLSDSRTEKPKRKGA